MRKLRPSWKEGGESKYELLVSATSIEGQVNALDVGSAQALFSLTLAVTVDGKDYLIESIASNEAFGTPTFIGCCCVKPANRLFSGLGVFA